MRVRDAEFYLHRQKYLKRLEEELKKQPKQVRDVKSLCVQLAFQEWLLTEDAKCEALNKLESEYFQKWQEEHIHLPEPLMSKALRKAVDKSGESSRERTCSLYFKIFDWCVC